MLDFISRFEIKEENDTFILLFDNSSYVVLGDRFTNEYHPTGETRTIQREDLVTAAEYDMGLLNTIANDENNAKRLLALHKLFSPTNKHQIYRLYGYLKGPLSTSLKYGYDNRDNVFAFERRSEVSDGND